MGNQIGSSAKDAVGAVSSLLVNPVGGLAPSYTSLGPNRALGAGIALCILFALIVSLGLVLGEGSTGLSFLFMVAGYGTESQFGLFIRAFVALLMLPAAMIAASYGIRKVLSGDGPLAVDAFTVGSALTPFGIGSFVTSILGTNAPELGLMLLVFAQSYLVLILYAGFTRLGGLTEKGAAPAVPVAFIISLYICKVVFGALM